MALAVCLLFDSRTERLIRDLWARLEDEGIRTLQSHTHRGHRPHLSYAVALEWDLATVREAVAELTDAGGFAVSFHGTLAFPRGRAALAPSVTPEVAQRQARVAQAVSTTGATLHRHYRPGCWIPHVAIATRAPGTALVPVVRAIADVLPLAGRVESAALIDSSTGQQWPLPRVP